MKKYGITTTHKLIRLCVDNDWLYDATPAQFEKIFRANKVGCTVDTITLFIWLCSPGADIMDIKEALTRAHEEYKMCAEGNNDG